MILRYPYPYRAWMSIANDPDNTLAKDWEELDRFIWKELRLPLANSLFVSSHNRNLPEQVNLTDHPWIADQPHDIIHTWGDFMHGGSRGFDRADALAAMDRLHTHGIQPRVWIDHAGFVGNVLHRGTMGAIPEVMDRSGHRYTVQEYTLDLIEDLGIRYIWDGTITQRLGQDRRIDERSYFKETSNGPWKALVKYGIHRIKPKPLADLGNEQYYTHRFPDGRTFYCFRRYGTWKDADIYGIQRLISPENLDRLIGLNGSMIVYTHLGKRPVERMNEAQHVPEATRAAFKALAERFAAKRLMVSSVSGMLDYMVIRDHLTYDPSAGRISFRSDGIRYNVLRASDLAGKRFSFKRPSNASEQVEVLLDGAPVHHRREQETNDIFSIVFPNAEG